MEAKRNTNTDHIPIDVLIDILSRLPAKFVWKLRSVCKQWQSLIQAPYFADLHLRRSKEICFMFWCGYLSHDRARFYSIDKDGKALRVVQEEFVPPTSDSISSTHGLICYMGTDGYVKVCNPVTHELVTLPKPNFFLSQLKERYNPYVHVAQIGIGFDSITKKYKVMAVLFAKISVTSRYWRELSAVEMFTLGESKGWREVRVSVPSSVKIYDWYQRLYANGCVYWSTSEFYNRQGDGDMTRALMEFNFAQEKFEFVPLPFDMNRLNKCYRLFEVRGCLCIRERKTEKVNLKTLANSSKQAWVDQHIVLPPRTFEANPISSGVMLTSTISEWCIFYYNEQGQFVKSTKVHGIPRVLETKQQHSQSLVSLKSIFDAAEA